MKRYYRLILSLLIIGYTSLGIVSCSDDKDKPEIDITALIGGTWQISEEHYAPEDNSEEGENGEPEKKYYPIDEKIYAYIEFTNSNFKYYHKDTSGNENRITNQQTGSYSINTSEIILSYNDKQDTGTYTLTATNLTLTLENDELIKIIAEKIESPDDTGDDNGEENGDNDSSDDDGEEEEEITGCAASHQQNLDFGSFMNPQLAELNTIYEGQLPDFSQNEYEYRYYLKVEPFNSYTIEVNNVDADYHEDLYKDFKYLGVTAKEELLGNRELGSILIDDEKNQTSGEFIVTPATGCLYIRIYSYQKSITFEIQVTETKPNTD